MHTVLAGLFVLLPLVSLAAEPATRIDSATVAAACSSCHGAPGDAQLARSIPPLDTQTAAALERKLFGYRDGSLQGTLMNRIARGFDEDELRAIARVLARP